MFDASKPLSQALSEQCSATSVSIQSAYGSSFDEIRDFLNAQYELVRLMFWTLHSDELSRRGPTQTILYSVLHKNAFLFFAALDLVRQGLYGPACTLLRPILEGLVCAKYCALADD